MPSGFELVDNTVSSTSVVIATYVPAGELVTGSFALEEPTEVEIGRRRNLQD